MLLGIFLASLGIIVRGVRPPIRLLPGVTCARADERPFAQCYRTPELSEGFSGWIATQQPWQLFDAIPVAFSTYVLKCVLNCCHPHFHASQLTFMFDFLIASSTRTGSCGTPAKPTSRPTTRRSPSMKRHRPPRPRRVRRNPPPRRTRTATAARRPSRLRSARPRRRRRVSPDSGLRRLPSTARRCRCRGTGSAASARSRTLVW